MTEKFTLAKAVGDVTGSCLASYFCVFFVGLEILRTRGLWPKNFLSRVGLCATLLLEAGDFGPVIGGGDFGPVIRGVLRVRRVNEEGEATTELEFGFAFVFDFGDFKADLRGTGLFGAVGLGQTLMEAWDAEEKMSSSPVRPYLAFRVGLMDAKRIPSKVETDRIGFLGIFFWPVSSSGLGRQLVGYSDCKTVVSTVLLSPKVAAALRAFFSLIGKDDFI